MQGYLHEEFALHFFLDGMLIILSEAAFANVAWGYLASP